MSDWRTRPVILAQCHCGWRSESANAHPVAKRHAQKCGKLTRVEVTVIYVYNDPAPAKKPEGNS